MLGELQNKTQRASQPEDVCRNISSAMEHAKKLKSCWRHISLFALKTSTLRAQHGNICS